MNIENVENEKSMLIAEKSREALIVLIEFSYNEIGCAVETADFMVETETVIDAKLDFNNNNIAKSYKSVWANVIIASSILQITHMISNSDLGLEYPNIILEFQKQFLPSDFSDQLQKIGMDIQ